MKIKNVLILVLLFALGFSRASSDYQVVLAPDLIFSAAFHHAGAKVVKGPSKDGDSIKWKRRHKRRKKNETPSTRKIKN